MSEGENQFHIRSAVETDADFIVQTFDSALPYLASIGAGEMWGDEPFSQREGFVEDIVQQLAQSAADEDSDDHRRILLAEREIADENGDGKKRRIGVATMMIREELPYYIRDYPGFADEVAKEIPLLFIEVLLSNHAAGERRKGSGAALVGALKKRGKEHGKRAIYLDAWAGNERRLNQ